MPRQCARAIRRRFKTLALVCAAVLAPVALMLFWPMDEAHYLVSESSCVMLDRAGHPMHVYLNSKRQWSREAELEDVNPLLIEAVVAAEDQRFWSHPGVDPLAALRASWQYVRDRRVRSGASTLTMQLTKLAGNPSHSFLGKLRQNFLAVRLDVHADKQEILRAYLNRASYGALLTGCEMAAQYYFGKTAHELNLSEAALIAALPNGPLRLNPLRRPDQALRRRNYVLDRMCEEGSITPADREKASAEPLGVAAHAFPRRAQHLASFLSPIARGRVQLITTLDERTQYLAEELVQQQLKGRKPDVKSGGILVIDASSAEVLAWVGEMNEALNGLAGGGASTLDPRLSGLTLEHFVTSLMSQDHDDLKPALMNTDMIFSSPIAHSMSLPLSQTSQSRAEEWPGAGPLDNDAEARFDEWAAAFCMLANHGQWRPLTILPGPRKAPRQLLSREAAQYLCEVLGQPRPGVRDTPVPDKTSPASRICWKTGSSHGGHGAWAFVFNEHYVVGTWTMGADARAARPRSGEMIPLAMASQMLSRLGPGVNAAHREEATGELTVKVCTLTGLPRTIYCPHFRQAHISWGSELNRVCGEHWPVKRPAPALVFNQGAMAPAGDSLHWSVPTSVKPWFGRIFSQGPSGSRLIALSFDDGPSERWTPEIVKILKGEAVPATFFMVGERVQKYPATTKLVANSGFEIGSHSFSHPDLGQLKMEAVHREILNSAAVIQRLTGKLPLLFRSPGGENSQAVSQVCAAEKMVVINWSVDPRDWAPSSTVETVCDRTVQSVNGGAIILLHDIHRKTVLALPRIIQRLKALGYEFTTVSRLIALEEEYRRMPPVPAVAMLGGGALKSSGLDRQPPDQLKVDGGREGTDGASE